MHHTRLARHLFLLCAVMLAFGCVVSGSREASEARVEKGEAFEDHSASEKCTFSGPVKVTPEGDISLAHVEEDEDLWFVRTGFFGIIYDQTFPNDVGAMASLGRRMGEDDLGGFLDGYFVEGSVIAAKAEHRFESRRGGSRYKVKDTGRNWYYTVNLGKECYFDDSGDTRWRAHLGVGSWTANSLTENDSSITGTAGVGVQARVSGDLWAHLGASYLIWGTDMARDDRSLRHAATLDLSLVFDF